MELDGTMLSELIKALRSSSSSVGEKRKNPRVGLRARAIVTVPPRGDQLKHVWVRDVSAGGLNMVAEFEVKAGINIDLILGEGQNRTVVPCTVRHCRRLTSGIYSLGARFDTDVSRVAVVSNETGDRATRRMRARV
jgi:hypothetical protein